MSRDRSVYLLHAQDLITRIRAYTAEGERSFKNVLAHKYLGVDIDLVWGIIERDLPLLERRIEHMVNARS